MSTFGDTLERAEAPYKAKLMMETWGHLDPAPGTVHTGSLTFINGGYQAVNSQPCNSEFPDFPGGPWFYDAMTDFIFSLCCNGGPVSSRPAGLYRWTGNLTAYKNGRIRFHKGNVVLLALI